VKIKLSRQMIYLLSLSVILFIVVLLFAFLILVPEGKDYRVKKIEVNRQNLEFRQLENYSYKIEEKFQTLKSDNRHIITAFNTAFNLQRFEKKYKTFFNSLKLSKVLKVENENGFTTYEVNTTSLINSPKSFYDFLDAINKSDWIIAINFPINFKRDDKLIKSSFSMKVYNNIVDVNTTKSE